MYIIFYAVALFACALGTICGMGGGVIIKPVLDAAHILSVSTINFISGVVVIGMTLWSVGKSIKNKESVINAKVGGCLAISAAIGGLLGKQVFQMVAGAFPNPDKAGGVQAVLLLIATVLTLIYTIRKDKISSKHVENVAVILLLGLFLGFLGAFLGIGGGPFNIAILCYFFSMPAKMAAQNSLLIVLFSQVASTGKAVLSGGIDKFPMMILVGMLIFAIIGSELGRRLNKKLTDKHAIWALEFAMVLIMGISISNIYRYLILV